MNWTRSIHAWWRDNKPVSAAELRNADQRISALHKQRLNKLERQLTLALTRLETLEGIDLQQEGRLADLPHLQQAIQAIRAVVLDLQSSINRDRLDRLEKLASLWSELHLVVRLNRLEAHCWPQQTPPEEEPEPVGRD